MKWSNYTDGYGTHMGSGYSPVPDVGGTHVSSQLEDVLPCSDSLDGAIRYPSDLHAPVFDIDQEVELVPSSTGGHYHLYSHTPTTWHKYKKAMKAMADAGIVDPAWVKLSIKRGYGLVKRADVTNDTPKDHYSY